ncbi:MAG: hypothetical protein M3Y58_01370 [Chloroflexota bacterium]|nr:hypothetical protein [Chloroflexota bacterium]
MQHARPSRIILLAITLALTTVTIITLIGSVSAAPPSSLVAQAATAGPTGSVAAPLPTAVSGSVAPGASSVSVPAIPATAATASDVAPPVALPPSALPPVDTGGGPDRRTIIETLIGIAVAVVIVPLGALGLIRLIANAGRL